MADPMIRRFRWRYLILPGLQTRLMLFVFWIVLVATVVVGWDVYYTAGRVFLGEASDPRMVGLLHKTLSALLAKLFIYGIIVAAVSLFVTHRIAGPLYRLARSMDMVAAGDLTRRIHLRRSDELQETAAAFNAMLDSVQRRVRAGREGGHAAAEELRKLSQEIRGTHAELADRLEILRGKYTSDESDFIV